MEAIFELCRWLGVVKAKLLFPRKFIISQLILHETSKLLNGELFMALSPRAVSLCLGE